MALTNFILTVVGVSGVVLLLGDVKKIRPVVGRNLSHIRNWLREEAASAAKEIDKAKPKEISGKDVPKDRD